MNEDKICLIDIDDTLFDFTGQLKIDLNNLRSPHEPEIDNIYDNKENWFEERIKLIKTKPNWWKNLPKLKLGWDLFYMAKSIGFNCHILTKGPKYCSTAWTQKFECIAENFGEEIDIDVVGRTKHRTYGRVLIDDYPDYILPWLDKRPRGLGIIPENEFNQGISHPNLIYYNGNNSEIVKKYLSAAFKREDNEHWDKYL